jgi:hypothetical protein
MRTSRGPVSGRQRLGRFALAALLAGCVSAARPAEAEIVFTPADITIGENSSYNLDLNNDGVTDFIISTSQSSITCPFNHISFYDTVAETPASGNGAEGSPPVRLIKGGEIGPSQTFYGSAGTMAWLQGCDFITGGDSWIESQIGYGAPPIPLTGFLGLELQLNGETYYGWAWLSVSLKTSPHNLLVTLKGYAYQNTPGVPINAGEMPPGNFEITTSPTSASVSPGESTSSTTTLTAEDGFRATVSLSCTAAAGYHVSCEVTPNSVTFDGTNSATATLLINTSSSSPAGTYGINVKGTYGTISNATKFTLTVP